jgi:hypothetical protein|tara:strand:- start:104 stop:334 length:231 start_codon:yes stop_codon:yes gene_type:complete
MSSEEEDKKARDIAAAKSAAAAARVVVDATWRVEVPIASKEQQQQRTSSRVKTTLLSCFNFALSCRSIIRDSPNNE